MKRESILLISFPGILILLTYAIYFHQSFLNHSINKNLLYNSFINSLKITTAIIITLTFFLYFFSTLLGGPLLYLFFSFMGHLLNLFNSSIIMIIIQKIFNIHLVHKKKIFLYYIIAFLISIYGLIRAELIYFDKNEIKVEHWKNEKEGLKVKISHLSDLHLGLIHGRKLVEKIITKLNKEVGISFIVITGDLIDGDMFGHKINLSILEPFKKSRYKIYYVTGNHEELTDKNRLFNLLEKVGITLLNNKIETLYKYKINLIGIGYDKNYKKVKNEIIPKLCEVSNVNNYINVAFSHIPFFKPKHLVRYNIFLFLCGHTHGAQMFPSNIYIWSTNIVLNGLYSYLNKYYVYCVSGVGSAGPPLRTFSRANIGLITLTK